MFKLIAGPWWVPRIVGSLSRLMYYLRPPWTSLKDSISMGLFSWRFKHFNEWSSGPWCWCCEPNFTQLQVLVYKDCGLKKKKKFWSCFVGNGFAGLLSKKVPLTLFHWNVWLLDWISVHISWVRYRKFILYTSNCLLVLALSQWWLLVKTFKRRNIISLWGWIWWEWDFCLCIMPPWGLKELVADFVSNVIAGSSNGECHHRNS